MIIEDKHKLCLSCGYREPIARELLYPTGVFLDIKLRQMDAEFKRKHRNDVVERFR